MYPKLYRSGIRKTTDGRFINDIDLKERRKVIVLHTKTAEILFGKSKTEPIGKFVNAGGVSYQVVGLYTDPGDQGSSEAYIPFSTLQVIYNKGDKLNNLTFTTKGLTTIETNEAFEAAYRKVMGAKHRFDPSDNSALWIWNRFTNYLQSQNAMGILQYSHLGDRYLHIAEWYRRRIEHYADHSKREDTRVRYPQSIGCQTILYPVVDNRGKRDHHNTIRIHRDGSRNRRYRMDE